MSPKITKLKKIRFEYLLRMYLCTENSKTSWLSGGGKFRNKSFYVLLVLNRSHCYLIREYNKVSKNVSTTYPNKERTH